MIANNFETALRDLVQRHVDFIVVGGMAAVLNGAPLNTFDLDVVYSRDPANLDRLLAFLSDADAIFRIQPERKLRPNMTHLAARGHLNLRTRYGPVDFLSNIGKGLEYDALLPNAEPIEIDDTLTVQVLDLETIIAVKEQLAGEKDLAMLPTLKAALREKQKNQ